ncbi:hypothetical protein BH09PAT2_BH09PAT2_05180 [soil metagenome]
MINKKGFTLIELLVVIGILAVLLAITLIAVNPGAQLQKSEDTQRRADINSTLNAINQYMIANNGNVPVGIGASATAIASTGANICAALVPTYIAALPQDPAQTSANGDGVDSTECAAAYATGYTVRVNSNRVTVSATAADGTTITVTR